VWYGLGYDKVEKEKERNKVGKQKKAPNVGYGRAVNHPVCASFWYFCLKVYG
jgi:hypothetical protein